MRFVLLALFLFCTPAFARDKITVDPNAGPAPSAVATPDADKDRMAQRITYEAKRQSVLVILEGISKLSGVTLKAGYNEKDWQVRDRKMNVFAKDVPLSNLMNSIGRVMKFKWIAEKGEKGRPAIYRLIMDRKTLLDAESQRVREEERMEALTVERRKQTLESYAKLSELSAADLDKLRKEDPYQYVLATSGYAKGLNDFFAAVPGAQEAMASGQERAFPIAGLQEPAQRACRQMLQSIMEIAKRMLGRPPDGMPPDWIDNLSYDEMRFTCNPDARFSWDRELGGVVAADVKIAFDENSHARLPLLFPGCHMAKAVGEILAGSKADGRSMEEMDKEVNSVIDSAAAADMEETQPHEEPIERPDDPALKAKIRIKPDSGKLEDVQAALAKESGLAVVSDNFGASTMDSRLAPLFKETEIRSVIEQMAKLYLYTWDKPRGAVEFRDRKWYRKRAAQIPDAWLEVWRESLKKNGTLSLDELAEIAVLSNDQISMNISPDPELQAADVSETVTANQDTLVLYAGLTEAQRKMLFTDDGLDCQALTPEQSTQVRSLISLLDAQLLEDADTPVILTAIRTQNKNGRTKYVFTAAVGEADKPLEWSFQAPRYIAPKEKASDKEPVRTEPAAARQEAATPSP